MCHHILPYYSFRQPIPGIKHLDMLLYQYCYIALFKNSYYFHKQYEFKMKDKIFYKFKNFTLSINFHKFIVIMNNSTIFNYNLNYLVLLPRFYENQHYPNSTTWRFLICYSTPSGTRTQTGLCQMVFKTISYTCSDKGAKSN